MDLLRWGVKYSVKVPEIDEQHMKLFEIINRLIAMKNKGSVKRGDIYLVLKEMLDYSRYHFHFEDTFIHQGTYIGKSRHTREHEKYVEKLHNSIERFENEKHDLFSDIITFLIEWWTTHILGIDKALGKHILENNLTED